MLLAQVLVQARGERAAEHGVEDLQREVVGRGPRHAHPADANLRLLGRRHVHDRHLPGRQLRRRRHGRPAGRAAAVHAPKAFSSSGITLVGGDVARRRSAWRCPADTWPRETSAARLRRERLQRCLGARGAGAVAVRRRRRPRGQTRGPRRRLRRRAPAAGPSAAPGAGARVRPRERRPQRHVGHDRQRLLQLPRGHVEADGRRVERAGGLRLAPRNSTASAISSALRVPAPSSSMAAVRLATPNFAGRIVGAARRARPGSPARAALRGTRRPTRAGHSTACASGSSAGSGAAPGPAPAASTDPDAPGARPGRRIDDGAARP